MQQALSYNEFEAIRWNANGTLHSYGKLQKRAFVVEVFLTSNVNGAILQSAVDKALERMPYFRWAIIRKKGLYYYATNDLPFTIANLVKPRKVGGEATNYHNVDVVYCDDKITFSMNHGFCDGLGLNRFIEAVLYHYFCMKDGVAYSDEGIYTDKIPYDEAAETHDAFLTKTDADRDKARQLASKEGSYRLPELDVEGIQGPTMYRMPVKVKESDLIAWCKSNATSPAAAVSTMLAQAVAHENDLQEGKIRSLAPISLRNFLHAEKAFTNCSAAVFLPMDVADIRSLPTGELAAQMRSTLKTQMNGEAALIVSSGINLMTHLAKRVPTFWLKNKVLTLSESKQDTFYVDYVGSLRTNDYSDQVREVRYLSADTCGGSMFLVLSATAGYFFMNFLQTFDTKRYYEAFCAILGEQGIPYEKLECDSYLNPEVEFGKEQR